VEHVAPTGGRRTCTVLMGKLEERHHSEDLGIDEGMILKWIFKKWNGRAGTGLI